MTTMVDTPSLGDAIRRTRRERELTQAEAAKALGTSQQNLANWELGTVPRPSDSASYKKTIRRLANFLGVSVAEVLRLAYAPWSDPSAEITAYERRLEDLHERLDELRAEIKKD